MTRQAKRRIKKWKAKLAKSLGVKGNVQISLTPTADWVKRWPELARDE